MSTLCISFSRRQNCTASSFGCKTGSVDCVDIDKKCDGAVDCTDGSDEDPKVAGCTPTCNGAGARSYNVLELSCQRHSSLLMYLLK